MIKSAALAVILPTAGIVAGVITVTTAVVAVIQFPSVGPDTPIEGLTLAGLIALIVAGVALVAKGGSILIRFGMTLGEWRKSMKEQTEQVSANTNAIRKMGEEIDALQRWRVRTDPILTELQRKSLTKDKLFGEGA